MASSLSQNGAARAAAQPPEQRTSFYKLVDKQVAASLLDRHARNIELAKEGAVLAEALFGDNSLVVASLRCTESISLSSLAGVTRGPEQELLFCRSWAVLVSIIPLLQRRLETDTLLPGTIRDEELEYEAHVQTASKKAKDTPVPPLAMLQVWASVMGYTILMDCMSRGLNALVLPWWPAAQKRLVVSFVLQGLDVITRTAGIPPNLILAETRVVSIIERQMSPRVYDPAFCAAVLRKWHSDAVSSVLRAHGVLQMGVAHTEKINAEFDARQREDVAKHGLRDCALPSCAKTEKTVKEFSLCAGSRSQVYCCLEHQALDWRAQKTACREKQATRRAAEEAERGIEDVDDGGAGAA